MELRERAVWILAVVAAAIVAGVAGGFMGANGGYVTVLSGTATAGDHRASVYVGDSSYHLPMDIPWQGTDGVWHDDGRPACLAPGGVNVPVRFGETWVHGPSGVSWPQVVWVVCVA